MISMKSLVTVCVLVSALSSCNTPEVLTPPADVGDGTTNTTSNYNSMAMDGGSSAQQQAFPAAPSASGQVVYNNPNPPQNSLDAQAQALAAGHGPMQPPPSVYGDNVSRTSQPMQQQGQQPAQMSQPAQMASLPPQQAAPTATSAGGATIRFLPIIGAPVQAVTPLSRQLGAEARASGLTIKGSNDPATDHILKGYFSAFSDSGQVNVVYVWDVLDASGARLHRIQGQEAFASAAGDPWSAVPPQLMQQIASKTISQYVSWRQGNAG